MFDTILGLPAHPLIVHITVVLLPTAAVAVGAAALWPRFRKRAGAAPLVLSVAALALVPITVESGRSLSDRVEETALIEDHRNLGEDMLPWVITLAFAATALFLLRRHELRSAGDWQQPHRLVVAGIVLVALVGAVGTPIQVVRVGHSGAEAAWSDVTSEDG